MEIHRTNFSEVLDRNGTLVYTNKGVSMLPLIRQNRDILIIKKAKPPFKKYDVVMFIRPNGEYILHRIVRVKGDTYKIIGDNCISGETVHEKQIIGILTSIKRDGKTINVDDKGYRFFVHFWRMTFPFRKCTRMIVFFLSRVKRKLFQNHY